MEVRYSIRKRVLISRACAHLVHIYSGEVDAAAVGAQMLDERRERELGCEGLEWWCVRED